MKKALLALLSLALLAVAVAVYLWNKPHRDIAGEVAAYTLTSQALATAFASDRTGADSLYLDQVIEVTGTITSIEGDTAKLVVLPGVACLLLASESEKVPAVGTQVTVKGRCTSFDDLFEEVKLDHCTLK